MNALDYTIEDLKSALSLIEEIVENGPYDAHAGLCFQSSARYAQRMSKRTPTKEEIRTEDGVSRIVGDAVVEWSVKRGAHTSYPVEGCRKAYLFNKNKWDKSDHFGKLRWDLTHYVKERIVKLLNEHKWAKL